MNPESDTPVVEPEEPAKSAAFLSRPRTKQILWAGAAVATLILFLFIAAAWIDFLRNPPGQIGWWKFDEHRGMTAKDSSHLFLGNNGKLAEKPRWVKGKRGGALDFNGRQYVTLGNIFQGSYDEISIACWIKHGTSQWQEIVERAVWDQPDGIGLMADYNGTSVTFGHYPSPEIKSKANVQDNQWHHVAGTMAKSGDDYIYSIYVDGQLDGTVTNATGLTATTLGWAIGARYDGTWNYQGLIDDVRIFNHALTPLEVRKLYRP